MRPSYSSIVILTGAGISADSGLATFRAEGGLWCEHRLEDVATPEGFARNSGLVQAFYNARRAQLKDVVPNAAHRAIARLAARFEGELLLVTQNVDDLHQRALAEVTPKAGFRFLAMHGELKRARCIETHELHVWDGDIGPESLCACCGETGTLRPHIVWFGEMPFGMPTIDRALNRCDLFLAIGTSGNVYPAAGFVAEARQRGAQTVELNLAPSLGAHRFDDAIYGKASETVPAFLNGLE